MRRRSFAPSPFSEERLSAKMKWDYRYANRHPLVGREPAPLLADWLPKLPQQGRALDIAAGAGRHSFALAAHGLRVDALDISFEGLRLLQRQAEPDMAIQPIALDLKRGWLPLTQYQVIINFYYLERALWPAMMAALAPGGWLIMETFTVAQLVHFGKKYIRREFMLERGELKAAFAGLDILYYAEGLRSSRHTARLVARLQ